MTIDERPLEVIPTPKGLLWVLLTARGLRDQDVDLVWDGLRRVAQALDRDGVGAIGFRVEGGEWARATAEVDG